MNKNKIAEHLIGGSIITTTISLVTGIITGLLVYLIKDFNFFLRPENAHYTEYNTPHFIDHTLIVQAYQDPLTLIMMLIPFVVFAVIFGLSFKYGVYDD